MRTSQLRAAGLVTLHCLLCACGGPEAEGGGSAEAGGGPGSGEPVAYGDGEYGILLTGPDPGIYCWYIGEIIEICDGEEATDWSDTCIPDEQSCLLYQPDDVPPDGTDTCYTRIDYSTVSGTYLHGDCEHHAAYWSSDPDLKATAECLFHGHCQEGQQCVDYLCE